MPNTLVHFGLQGAISKAFAKQIDIRWVFLGCLIPDLPWILRRIVIAFDIVDPYQLGAYSTIQASLAFCLILALAISQLAIRPLAIFAVLGANSLLHLLLDATQIKLGNGVLLFAPLTWKQFTLGWFWPNSTFGYAFTAVGLTLVIWLMLINRTRISISTQPKYRVFLAFVFLSAYLLLPVTLRSGPLESGNSSLGVLHATEERQGNSIELDRVPYRKKPNGNAVVTFTGEHIWVRGPNLPSDAYVSLRGIFVDSSTIEVEILHVDSARFRDAASYLGLILFVVVWLRRSATQQVISEEVPKSSNSSLF